MKNHSRTFPLVADDDPVISHPRRMQLYENTDLITNIRGDYQDKNYADVTRDYQTLSPENQSSAPKERLEPIEAGRTYAEQARQTARADLKQKRQHLAVSDKPMFSRRQDKSDTDNSLPASLEVGDLETVKQPELPVSKPSGLAKYSQYLKQDSYILADIRPEYKEPEQSDKDKPKKNSYDFLKRSQVYNYEANQLKKERQVAQELNLTRFDDLS